MNRARLIGVLAIGSAALYFLSDLIETVQGGFSTGQLWLTLAAEAVIPVMVIGLYLVQRPQIGRLGAASAAIYAYAFAYFTYTVIYALVNETPDFEALGDDLGFAMTLHGAIMLIGGLGFGYAVVRAQVLPRWTGFVLMAGVALVVLAQGLPGGWQLLAAAVRDLAFAGMGVALVSGTVPDGRPTAPGS